MSESVGCVKQLFAMLIWLFVSSGYKHGRETGHDFSGTFFFKCWLYVDLNKTYIHYISKQTI